MRKPTRTPDPAAVARSLRELEKLFVKRPPEKEIAALASGEIGTTENVLPAHDNTKTGVAK